MTLALHLIIWLLVVTLAHTKSLAQHSPLRLFFNHIDLNHNDELDVNELQHFFSNIEPKDVVADGNHVVDIMKHVMKHVTDERENAYLISWQQFRETYRRLDTFIEKDAPEQIHLSLLADGNWSTVIVIWIVKGNSEGKQQPFSFVQYGNMSGSYTREKAATNRTYDVGIGGWKGTIFEGWMTDLDPCRTYYYRVGNSKALSGEMSFKTDCPTVSKHTFAVMGDMGTVIPAGYLVTEQIVEDHQATPFSAVIHVGDICYAGTGGKVEISEIWDIWGVQVEPISSIVPYITNVGNHEAYYNYTAYRNRFRMPGPESEGFDNFWFSFNIGPVHWISMSTQHDYAKDSPQYAWLVNDLIKASANRAQRPFIIVITHRPLLCSTEFELNEHLPNSTRFETVYPLFVQYQVQLIITGHAHVYERIFYDNTTTIVNNTYTNVHSPVIVVQGTGGAYYDDKWTMPQPWWSKARLIKYGYGRVTVSSNRLNYEYLVEDNRSIYDQFSIVIQ